MELIKTGNSEPCVLNGGVLLCLPQEKEQLMQLQELQVELASRSLELESFQGTVDSSEQVFILTSTFKPPTIPPFAAPFSHRLFSFTLLVRVSSSIPPFCSCVTRFSACVYVYNHNAIFSQHLPSVGFAANKSVSLIFLFFQFTRAVNPFFWGHLMKHNWRPA